MKAYDNYTITVTLKSSLITPFQSDTIFGHFCWAVQYLKWDNGENRLETFLNAFDANDSPPLLISNGFPEGFLPKPILSPVFQKEIARIVGLEDRVEKSYTIKTIKKFNYIRKDHFNTILGKGLNGAALFEILYNNYDAYKGISKDRVFNVQRNSVNRIYNTVTEGLHLDRETFSTVENNRYEFYLKTNFFSYKDLERIFNFISRQGFGKNKSTGTGALTFRIAKKIDIPQSESPNGFMTLSSYIPTQSDPTDGYYDVLHKFGKLAGGYQSVLPEAGATPFKIPLLMMKAGSVFKDKYYSANKHYGSLLKNVHVNSDKIRHYALAFPIGVFVKEGNNGD